MYVTLVKYFQNHVFKFMKQKLARLVSVGYQQIGDVTE